MWDEEDGFFYDVLRLPDGEAQRLKVRSMVGLLPLCAATTFEGELLAKNPELAERFQWFLAARPELYAAIHDPMKPGVARPPARIDPGRNQAPPRAGEDARRERVLQPVRHPLALALPRRSPLCHPCRRPGIPCFLLAGGVRYRHVRRQLELARAHLDAGQCPDHPGIAPVLPLLRRRLHRRMSHGLRPADEPLPGGRGDRATAGEHLSQRQGRSASGLWRNSEVPGRPALARLRPVLRVFPRRQRRRPRCQPPDRLDGRHRPHYASVCDPARPSSAFWKAARSPISRRKPNRRPQFPRGPSNFAAKRRANRSTQSP